MIPAQIRFVLDCRLDLHVDDYVGRWLDVRRRNPA